MTAFAPHRSGLTVVLGTVVAGVVGLLVLVFVLLLCRALGEPSPVTPDRTAIVGTWVNSDGARLVFRADGTYTATDMPVIDEPGSPEGFGPFDDLPTNGTGTWQIQPWDASSGSGGGLALTDTTEGVQLTTTGDPAHPCLFATIGDPDDGDDFGFTKQPD